ncbi:hypothetical protein PsalMR5_00579 [Piscirickettsia salmonis]|uniref:hypothetical protein n=1 Tax=Piscirickettsia salmonis TaxID=1238 RepID=UPI0012BADD19|nr:hypothetical protein [Piscirickettsia salmonis]QGP53172.1 hypothetical protein PsalSR1_00578 [Piscirickettsia salmonis]QGP60891.1 hypothetical protein PsalBI1_03513 [Piscirickettsia salmonis]QGP62741.1 hypothetical protein PsalMR5_00579 [Piscirickettsia salmonis]
MPKLFFTFDGTNANPDYKSPLGQATLVELNSMAAQLHSENYSAAEVELTAYQGVLAHIERSKFYFAGPGTSNRSSQKVTNYKAMFDGNKGEFGLENTTNKALEIIKYKIQNLTENAILDIDITGWSRGGIAAFQLLKKLQAQLSIAEIEKLGKVHSYGLDPVPGGPLDRRRLDFASLSDQTHPFIKKVSADIFYAEHSAIITNASTPYFQPLFSPLPKDQHKLWVLTGANHDRSFGSAGIDSENMQQVKQAIANHSYHDEKQHTTGDFSCLAPTELTKKRFVKNNRQDSLLQQHELKQFQYNMTNKVLVKIATEIMNRFAARSHTSDYLALRPPSYEVQHPVESSLP